MTVETEPSCTYCGHPRGFHPPTTQQACWGEVRAVGGGWRSCRCTGWQEPA